MGSTSTTTQKADPYKPTQPYIAQGLKDAGALYDAGGFNISPYEGSMVAGYDPMRAQADAATGGVVQNGLNMAGQGQNALTAAMDPNARSGAFGQVVQNTINSIMPGINSSFAGSGMTGSGLHAQNLAKGLGAGIADVENQAWQQGQDRAVTAAGMVPGLNNAAYGALDYLRGAGADRQEYGQNVLNADIIKDQQTKTAGQNAIQDYLALMSGVGSQFGIQKSTQSQNPGLFNMLGMGMQAAPLLFSDVRLKKDIKRVGETDEGLGVYQYRYKAGGPVHIGLMAQEVERTRPDAVKEVGGYKAVDYSKALEKR
jgi:hypothetical protein